jgi:hypothetical protein
LGLKQQERDHMTLVSDLEELARQKIGGDNLWYTWDLDDRKLPDGTYLPSQNKTIALAYSWSEFICRG